MRRLCVSEQGEEKRGARGEEMQMQLVGRDNDITLGRLTASSAGLRMTADQFFGCDDWQEPYFFELINGVVVATRTLPAPDAACNDELNHRLRNYMDDHPAGSCVDDTLYGVYVRTRTSVRRVGRAIWTGLGRVPQSRKDVPSIIIDFVLPGRAAYAWDVTDKAAEFITAGCREYWVMNRFERTFTIYLPAGQQRMLSETGVLTTPLLPGLEITMRDLFAEADKYSTGREELDGQL
jgi:Uma2 family endonuclease